jgi:hypothetical protein
MLDSDDEEESRQKIEGVDISLSVKLWAEMKSSYNDKWKYGLLKWAG